MARPRIFPRVPRPTRTVAAGLLVLLGGSAPGRGQCPPEFRRELEPFLVIDGFGPVPHAWYGGWENPRPQLLDVDQDGDLDLFVNEEDGKLRFFRNDGTPSLPDLVLQTDDYAAVHELYYSRFADLDADGDFDLLVEAPPFIVQVGDQQLEFPGAFLYTDVGSPGNPVYRNLSSHPEGYLADENGDPIAIVTTTPDFVDLDGDGDQDLLMGDPSGRVILYRNVGSPGDPVFRFETDSYRDLVIVFGSCNPEVPALRAGAAPDPRHGFMLFSFFDLNADSSPDLFVGDQFNSNVYHWLNVGGSPSPDFSCQTQEFFRDASGFPGIFGIKILTAFGDLDGDGDADALFGSGESGDQGLFFYRNLGSPSFPFLVQESDDWLREFDRGGNTSPAFADLDGDADVDLLLGVGSAQQVSHYDNIGSATAPMFAEIRLDWAGVGNSGWAAPELADIDDDGDLDLFVGKTGGSVLWFRNDGSGPDPAGFPEILDDPDFGDAPGRTFWSSVNDQATPRFFDGDGDGDLDALLGNWNVQGDASLLYFRNDGTPSAHRFVLASRDYQGLGSLGQNLSPDLADLDGDGDPDLLVGNLEGTLQFFRNVGTPAHPAFVPETDWIAGVDVGASSTPFFADLDGDGDLDLVVGESGGGLNFFRNVSGPPSVPTAFALREPAPGAVVEGAAVTTFDWDPSFDPDTGAEVGYELRLAAGPDTRPSEWLVLRDLQGSQASVRLDATAFRFLPELYWTVVATDGCRNAPVPEWRRIQHPGFVDPPDAGQDHAVGFPVDAPPEPFAITDVFPSPSDDVTTIRFQIPFPGRVRVAVHDASGRLVALLRDGPCAAGPNTDTWDGRTRSGESVGPGVYVVRVAHAGRMAARRIVRLR